MCEHVWQEHFFPLCRADALSQCSVLQSLLSGVGLRWIDLSLEDGLRHCKTEKIPSSVTANLFLMIFLLVSVPSEVFSWPDLPNSS